MLSYTHQNLQTNDNLISIINNLNCECDWRCIASASTPEAPRSPTDCLMKTTGSSPAAASHRHRGRRPGLCRFGHRKHARPAGRNGGRRFPHLRHGHLHAFVYPLRKGLCVHDLGDGQHPRFSPCATTWPSACPSPWCWTMTATARRWPNTASALAAATAT